MDEDNVELLSSQSENSPLISPALVGDNIVTLVFLLASAHPPVPETV